MKSFESGGGGECQKITGCCTDSGLSAGLDFLLENFSFQHPVMLVDGYQTGHTIRHGPWPSSFTFYLWTLREYRMPNRSSTGYGVSTICTDNISPSLSDIASDVTLSVLGKLLLKNN